MAHYAFSKCGRPLENENSCCGYCGTWHGYGSSRKIKAQSKCSKCGRDVEQGRTNCSYCWTKYGRR